MQSEDASDDQQSQQARIIDSEEPIHFDWGNKWLKGHQYAFILNNIQAYCDRFNFIKYPHKTHPIDIYENPQNGMIYFVQGKGVGSEFGFPRVPVKKKFRWKKMNFTTQLPKKNPQVTYVVASAVKSHRIDQNQHPLFRMHAVVIHGQAKDQIGYILCHVRQMQKKKQQENLQSCFEGFQPNFYKLFAFVHNFQMQSKEEK